MNSLGQAPLAMGFPRQEYWSGDAISSSRGSSWRRDWTLRLNSPALAGGFFTTEPPEKPTLSLSLVIFYLLDSAGILSLLISATVVVIILFRRHYCWSLLTSFFNSVLAPVWIQSLLFVYCFILELLQIYGKVARIVPTIPNYCYQLLTFYHIHFITSS